MAKKPRDPLASAGALAAQLAAIANPALAPQAALLQEVPQRGGETADQQSVYDQLGITPARGSIGPLSLGGSSGSGSGEVIARFGGSDPTASMYANVPAVQDNLLRTPEPGSFESKLPARNRFAGADPTEGMYANVPSARDNLLRTPAPTMPQDRHPGMPASVANFDGAQIVRDAAAAHQSQRPAQGLGQKTPSTPVEGVYVPSGIKPAGGVRTGDPFLDVNTDFGALAADKAVKDANDAAFTQMNRGHMSGIAATREAANSDRNSRLQQMGKTPDEIERIMYPERFSDLRGEAMANVEGRAKPARMSQQAFDETNGRISSTSRADALMRKARLNGQNLPYAQAYGMAQNDLPQTGPDTVGQASLPGMNPARMAQFNPHAGAAAGMYMNGNQRNANEAAAEQGRQGLVATKQANDYDIASRQQNTNDAVAKDALGNPELKRQKEAQDWLNTPAAQAMRNSTDPQDRAFYAARRDQAAGNQSAAAPAGAPAQPGAAPAPGAQASGLPTTEQFLANNPAAMNTHLANFPDELSRQRELARIYALGGRGSDPAVAAYLDSQFNRDNPDLAWGPDNWHQSYSGGQSFSQGLVDNYLGGLMGPAGSLIDPRPISQRAADYAAEHYGIPADVALPHVRRRYGN